MKQNELKDLIKVAVREAIQEELKDILLEAVKSNKQPVNESYQVPLVPLMNTGISVFIILKKHIFNAT